MPEDTWSQIHVVSQCDGEIHGYFKALINRNPRYVKSINAIKLSEDPFVFGRDLVHFIRMLLDVFRFPKICFAVVVGSPAEQLYDKAIQRLDGRIVGVFKQHCQTPDGKIHDMKWYEIINNRKN